MFDGLVERFARLKTPVEVDFCSLRAVCEVDEIVTVRMDVPQPVVRSDDTGVMITVINGGGMGYAATSDLSTSGLERAARSARDWARLSAGRMVVDLNGYEPARPDGEYEGPEAKAWDSMPLADKFELLGGWSSRLGRDDPIVDWSASLWHTRSETLQAIAGGPQMRQRLSFMAPSMEAVANEGAETQRRTFHGSRGCCRQGGLEVLDEIGMAGACERIAEEAVELLSAPMCPTGTMPVVLAPDQMILQIHESVGHPLELDRILGDERNYAGTSFVTPDMFGTYRYGSDLLNITFDPTRSEQFASYGFDDGGERAGKVFIIREGVLERPLGGRLSRFRAGQDGTANSRACSWNRPPIDRMANLNLEPGERSLEELIEMAGHGVYMETNCSWSIDDSRNKFQFGCERARLIEDGRLGPVVKKPNYRGISATFWRNLRGVGSPETLQVLGTPYCGKGEPNQGVRVGHASPPCLFADVEVFGGA